MNKPLIITVLILLCIFVTGCGVYGQGDTYGYVTTVERGGPIESGIFGFG